MVILQFLILIVFWLRIIQSITRARDLNKVKFFKCNKDKDDEVYKVHSELF